MTFSYSKVVYLLVLDCVVWYVAAKGTSDLKQIDLILDGLKREKWSQQEKPCFEKTILVVENVKNYTLWATWIWNSMEQPVGTFYGSSYSLGSYDQCLQATSKAASYGVRTQYCLAEVELSGGPKMAQNIEDTETFFATKTKLKRNVSKINWGVCVPSVCEADSVAKILKVLYLVNPITPTEPTIAIDHCVVAGATIPYSVRFYAFIAIITVLISIVLFSTYYVKESESEKKTNSMIFRVANCFSLKTNWESLTKTYSDDDIVTASLIKVGMCYFAVVAHAIFYRIHGPLSNRLGIEELISAAETEYIYKRALGHLDLPVELFLFMSGLFLMKGLVKKKKHPAVTIISRYFRLIGTLAVIILYTASVSIYMGDGPVWQKMSKKEEEYAAQSWHWGLLMLNNFIAVDKITHIVAWNIPCDYHLAVFGTLLYYLHQKKYRFAKPATILVIILAVLLPGIVTYWKGLPANLLCQIGNYGTEDMLNLRTNRVFLEAYGRPYYRAVPYLLGMAMGYFMTVYKPQNHRRAISTETSIILLGMSVSIAVKTMSVSLSMCAENNEISSAVYTIYSRLIFGFAACLLFSVMEYGDIPFIRNISKFHGITVLNRLTYGIYLTHTLFLQQNVHSGRHVQHFNLYNELIYSFGVICESIVLSIILWLIVESPLNNLVNLVTNSRNIKEDIKDSRNYHITSKCEDTFESKTKSE